jgi:serine/threonine protein kinase
MARFQREAQVLAALNHPHIAAIYGIEQSALVTELVEGHNLTGPFLSMSRSRSCIRLRKPLLPRTMRSIPKTFAPISVRSAASEPSASMGSRA